MRFAQILNKKVHYIFIAEKKPEFARNIYLVDITNQPEVQENWDYDEITNRFMEPVYDEKEPPRISELDLLKKENEELKASQASQDELIMTLMLGGA